MTPVGSPAGRHGGRERGGEIPGERRAPLLLEGAEHATDDALEPQPAPHSSPSILPVRCTRLAARRRSPRKCDVGLAASRARDGHHERERFGERRRGRSRRSRRRHP